MIKGQTFQYCWNRKHDTYVYGRQTSGGCTACHREQAWAKQGILNPDGTPFLHSDYDYALKIQNNTCFLCPTTRATLKKGLAPDHDHTTGHFRKLLCGPCNQALGHYEKMKPIAEAYLKASAP